ncbi:MAG: ABC transporter permease [Gaiellaceae bacterium]
MNELFGISTGALATVLAVVLVCGLGVVAVLAIRNRILFKLGVRNIPRRRGRTALIVLGLMLGTAIIAAALATGDTMSATIRSSVLTSLGQTDEIVSAKGADLESVAGGLSDSTQTAYFDESAYPRIRDAVAGSPLVDGVAPAIFETVAVQDKTSRQNEPRVRLFATDPAATAGFDAMRSGGKNVTLAQLAPGEVYVNGEAADELGTRVGDELEVLAGDSAALLRVRAIVEYDGAGTDGAALIVPLGTAQRLLGREGQIEHVLVSNAGDEVAGAKLSDEVMPWLAPTLAQLGLEADPEKADGLETADEEGAGFMSLFTTFGSFSIAAGILLIFLIFVMLAAERRGELGIARAIGTRRSHLVQMYLFEGVAYDVVAAAVGTLLGIAVAYGMVIVMSRALTSFGIDIGYSVSFRSITLAYALGVLLTLIVVTVSAWRVSVLNIASAVRNLPEPPKQQKRRRWLWPLTGIVLGVLLTVAGVQSKQAVSFMLGVSLVLVSLAPVARLLGAPDRIAFTAAGLAIVVFWLLPSDTFTFIAEFAEGFGVFLVGGLMIVVGATWVIMYNADLLLGALSWSLGRIRTLAPVLKLSIAYPMRSLFRTGVTLAMFTLVVFTLVVGTTISGSFMKASNDLDAFSGGFDVRAVASTASPLHEPSVIVPAQIRDVKLAGSQAIVPLDAAQAGAGRAFESYPVNGLDERFTENTTYGFAAMAKGYESAKEVWTAVATRPGLAVVDQFVAPRRNNYTFGPMPDFRLSGFYLEDGSFDPVPVDVRDPQTGKTSRLTIIGVLKDTTPELMTGISTSDHSLAAAAGGRGEPTVYWFGLDHAANAAATAKAIESAFLENGVEAEALQETLDDVMGAQKTFNYLVSGFMGLGLIVGVAALGVISARAVVERRQQIGVLRSIGFQRRMIQAAFLIESSFVALTAIVVGTLLALVIAYNIVADTAEQPGWETLTFSVPWLTLGLIFLVVYVVSLATTLAPALRASRVYPAEALRYQ